MHCNTPTETMKWYPTKFKILKNNIRLIVLQFNVFRCLTHAFREIKGFALKALAIEMKLHYCNYVHVTNNTLYN